MFWNTVYIVDDDTDVGESLAFFLESAGFVPRIFADARAFVATAASLPPGCVLLDVRMPDIDGFEVLERLKLKQVPLPVVVMTGHGDVVTAVRAMKLGADDFIEKPCEESVLLDILAQVFASLEGRIEQAARRQDAKTRLRALTDREREVLVALLGGRSNKVVAFELDISVRTVEMHRAAMMERLHVRTFAAALRIALDGGIKLDAVTIPAAARPR